MENADNATQSVSPSQGVFSCPAGEKELPQSALSNPEDEPFVHIAYRAAHGIRPGGFGILMSRELVDDLLYNEKGNEVLLIKYLNLED